MTYIMGDGVYPRACGGTIVGIPGGKVDEGLSPRVRGNRTGRWHRRLGAGSIPARAGEPCGQPRAFSPPRVYPRACGGTPALSLWRRGINGLSPRVRGNRRQVHVVAVAGRSIPARAGEPASSAKPDPPPSVYPRACGGTRYSIDKMGRDAGLSPRVRGNP